MGGKNGKLLVNEGKTESPERPLVDTLEHIGQSLTGLPFSVCLADPAAEDCPLMAVSHGFTILTGYEQDQIIGRNCRFLIDPIPEERTCMETRAKIRKYCTAVTDETLPERDIFAIQINMRADGTEFRNAFLLHSVTVRGRPLIFGLQLDADEEEDPEMVLNETKNCLFLQDSPGTLA